MAKEEKTKSSMKTPSAAHEKTNKKWVDQQEQLFTSGMCVNKTPYKSMYLPCYKYCTAFVYSQIN